MRQVRHKSRTKADKSDTITDRVLQVAADQGLETFRGIAERAGVHHSTIARGAGEDDWSERTLRLIGRAFSVDWRWLLNGDHQSDRVAEQVETYRVGAGTHFVIADEPPADWTDWPVPDSLYAFRVDGDSMEPVAQEGQTVLAIRGAWPKNGDLAYLELNDNTVMFRRVVIVNAGRRNERWLLQPVNPAHNVKEVMRRHVRHAMRIWGVMFSC